jgi:hypothetical protein
VPQYLRNNFSALTDTNDLKLHTDMREKACKLTASMSCCKKIRSKTRSFCSACPNLQKKKKRLHYI